ncbi:MAG: biotin transporter BioY [Myxococcota bacterium]
MGRPATQGFAQVVLASKEICGEVGLVIRRQAIIGASVVGAGIIALLAQLKLSLPGLALPITGQTLAVALVSGWGGAWVGVPAVLLYIAAAAAGWPVLSGGRGGWDVVTGPSLGYLAGFVASARVIPFFLGRWGRTRWVWVWLAIEAGSVCVLGFGALGLIARGMSPTDAFTTGVWPFLPGDLVKSSFAATLLWLTARRVARR